MNSCIITVGDELLSGRTLNSNAAHLGRELGKTGAPVSRSVVVADDILAIAKAAADAVGHADVLIITGGLGPTHDDVTLDGLAAGLKLELNEDSEIYAEIESRYRKAEKTVPSGARRMARKLAGAVALPNHWGTAPGYYLLYQKTYIFVLPGVPGEMMGILEESVLPRLGGLPGLTPLYVRALSTAGVPESILAEQLSALIPSPGDELRLAFLPGYAGVELRLTTRSDPAAVDRLTEKMAARIGPALVGEAAGDDLVVKVARLLSKSGRTLATAESCTGGLLGKLLTDRAGSSDFYRGGLVAYADAAKVALLGVLQETLLEHGAVSASTALAMARGARERLDADYALSITGIAGPGGGTPEKPVGLIYLGLAWGDGEDCRKLRLTADRQQNRARSAYAALDFLRRHLLEKNSVK